MARFRAVNCLSTDTDSVSGVGRWIKSTLIISSGIILCGSIYILYKRWRQSLSDKDEGFVDVSKCDDDNVTKVLLVGLHHSGKSSIMSQLQLEAGAILQTADGCHVTCVTIANTTVSIWHVSSDTPAEWCHFVQDTSVLVYVVDSSNPTNLPDAFDALHTLLGDMRLQRIPIIVLANKQDIEGALSPQQIVHALGLDNMSMGEHRVHVIATTTSHGDPTWLQQLQTLVVKLAK